jgi:predicted transcriptional regulator
MSIANEAFCVGSGWITDRIWNIDGHQIKEKHRYERGLACGHLASSLAVHKVKRYEVYALAPTHRCVMVTNDLGDCLDALDCADPVRAQELREDALEASKCDPMNDPSHGMEGGAL